MTKFGLLGFYQRGDLYDLLQGKAFELAYHDFNFIFNSIIDWVISTLLKLFELEKQPNNVIIYFIQKKKVVLKCGDL